MPLLVVGSVALDSVDTPFGGATEALGGSAVFFAVAGCVLYPVQVVGVVGSDFPILDLRRLAKRGIDLAGVESAEGESFRWKGKYSYDLSSRETLETRLGVFADFHPKLPPAFRKARYVFLGNIDPELQLSVLDQVTDPGLVACDTMNYWIHGKRDVLLQVLRNTDILMVNDAEVRELSGDWNVHRAADWILKQGPRMVVIKQGEHGAILVTGDYRFIVPAYPLQEVRDPTGAGDAFAGGFMAYVARTGNVTPANLRRAMVYGTALGSFAVEDFSVRRLAEVTLEEVETRVRAIRDLVHFELVEGGGGGGGGTRGVTTERYRAAGVDLDVAEAAKRRIAELVKGTRTALSTGLVGAFGGMIRLPGGLKDPVLVMSTDGVGTKVLVAFRAGRHDTVGEDLVNHSVNDILVHGARPIAFLDYIASAAIDAAVAAQIVEGVARGCKAHDMALVGGETAALPDLYSPGHYDLAGTIVGVVEAAEALHGDRVSPGDVLIGYASSGLHTNGYTLARRIIFDDMGLDTDDLFPEIGRPVADVLLDVHRSYAAAVRPVISRIHALAHISGAGIPGNLIRVLPEGCRATVDEASWEWPPLFRVLQAGGKVSTDEMRRVFNLGVGLIAIAAPGDVDPVRRAARGVGIETWTMGVIKAGPKDVDFHK